MRLTELEPKWIHPNVLTFLCPHCKLVRLTCKNVAMRIGEQFVLFAREYGEPWNQVIVPADPEYSWGITGSLEDLTVTPSLDASKAGHWHGNIVNGQVITT